MLANTSSGNDEIAFEVKFLLKKHNYTILQELKTKRIRIMKLELTTVTRGYI